jgi:hypothetical protein
MTSEGLGEMFEGDSADKCTGRFPLVSMGAERRVSRAQTRERGTPSVLVEIHLPFENSRLNYQLNALTGLVGLVKPLSLSIESY